LIQVLLKVSDGLKTMKSMLSAQCGKYRCCYDRCYSGGKCHSGYNPSCSCCHFPNLEGTQSVLLDVGLNPDSRPDVLYQYGILGSAYATAINKISKPRVALINIGSEEEKGN
jgi:hypothetical protein